MSSNNAFSLQLIHLKGVTCLFVNIKFFVTSLCDHCKDASHTSVIVGKNKKTTTVLHLSAITTCPAPNRTQTEQLASVRKLAGDQNHDSKLMLMLLHYVICKFAYMVTITT